MSIPSLKLTKETVGPIARGHPWVYEDGIHERPPVGTVVRLVDHRNKTVAFGLMDEGPIAVRVLGRFPVDLSTLLRARFQTALQERSALLPPNTTAYRLINGAGDGLPGLVADRYGPVIILRLYGKCWAPHLESIAMAAGSLDGIETVARRFGVRRVDGKEGIATLQGTETPKHLVVLEGGLKFLVRPHVGQKTGLFLDHRDHRILVGRTCRGASLVNLFGYTGGFSVHAAAGGADEVTTVDIAPDAIEDAKENFRLNSIPVDKHRFVVADAFKWKPDFQPSYLICDPPSLSHGRSSDRNAANAYKDLAEDCGRMVMAGGLLATASCTARLNQTSWERAVSEGLRKSGRWSWLWRASEPPDHPVATEHHEGRYLKFGLLRKRITTLGQNQPT